MAFAVPEFRADRKPQAESSARGQGPSPRRGWLAALGLDRHVEGDTAATASPAGEALVEETRLVSALDDLIQSKLAAHGLHGRLADALGRLVRYVRGANSKCLKAVAQLGVQACEATINMGWVFHDAREVAQSTESISSAVEEMAASITELSNSSDASASQAEMARDTMRSCINDSRGATDAMAAIQERASNIEQRLGVLQGAVDQISGMAGHVETIARQTNLLALNATIEAARAGEHGRGFAVVASEVKALSIETSKATKEIHARIRTLKEEMDGIKAAVKDSLKSVSAGSAVVKQVSTIIEGVGDEVSEIADRIRGLSDLLQQQRAATAEIARNAARISEKAIKTRDEVAAIGRRLEQCESTVGATLEAAAHWPIDQIGLIRFAADASAWKRRLSSILLAAETAPDNTPRLAAEETLAEAEKYCAAHSNGKGTLAELTRALEEARRNADVVIAEVRRANWGGATPAYIACEQALNLAIASVSKLSKPAGSGGPP
jgi:methyl-accepting chemotaxis protein